MCICVSWPLLPQAYRQGRLNERGHLAGGRTGKQLTYTKEGVRDDWLGWVDGSKEEGFTHLPQYMLKVRGRGGEGWVECAGGD